MDRFGWLASPATDRVFAVVAHRCPQPASDTDLRPNHLAAECADVVSQGNGYRALWSKACVSDRPRRRFPRIGLAGPVLAAHLRQ